MFKFADKPLDFADIVKSGIELYRFTLKDVWYLVLANMVLFAIIYGVLNYFVPIMPSAMSNAQVSSLTTSQVILMWVCDILIFLVSAFFFSLVMHRMFTLGKGDVAVTLMNSVDVIKKKYLVLVAVTFIFFVTFLIGAILLLIPGIVVAIFLAFCVPLVLFDDVKIFVSLKESVLLVWGNWWRTFAALFPVVAALLLLNLVAQFLFAIVSRNIFFLSLVNAVVMTAFQSAVYAFVLVQFNDLKLRKGVKPTVVVESKPV